VSIISPEDGSYLASGEVTVTWNCTEENLDHFEVRVDGGDWVNVGTNTSYTVTLGEGVHTVYIRAVDAVGHTGEISASFTVDTTAPQLTITSPEDGATVSPGQVEIAWECTEENLDHFEVRVDGGDWVNVGTNTSYTVTLTDGEHTIDVRAVDRAGNIAEKSITVNAGTQIFGASPWLLVGIILLIAVLLAAVLLMVRRKSPGEYEEAMPESEETETSGEPEDSEETAETPEETAGEETPETEENI